MATDPSHQGVIPPPPGVTPNFVNPSYISGGTVPVSAVFLTLSSLCLLLRLYTKARIIKVFGSEDYVIIVAWVFNVVSTAIALIQQNNGNGRHIWDIPLTKFFIFEKWGAAAAVVYIPAAGLAKVAILIFYLRINPDRRFRWVVFTVIFIVIGYMIAIAFSLIFACHPIAKFWDPALTGQCVKLSDLYLANGILNVVTDFLVLLVPVPMLIALHVGIRQKALLASIFAIGSLTCIVSAIRIYYVSSLLHTYDASRDVPVPTTLGIVETNLTIICGSLMVLRPFIRHHLPFLSKGDSTPYKPDTSRLNYDVFGDSTKKNTNVSSKPGGTGAGESTLYGGGDSMRDGKDDGDGYVLDEVAGTGRGLTAAKEVDDIDMEKGGQHATLRDDYERREALTSWPMPIESNARH